MDTNTTQKIWMNAPHNKKKRYGGRSRRRNYNYRNNAVFGDSAVPSLHDVTLKMHKVIDHADNALLSFKPINYNRIHKRWKNKKYKLVSGGQVKDQIAEVQQGIDKVTDDVSGLKVKLDGIEKKDATVSPSVASSGDDCLDSKAQRTFSGRLKDNDTIVITEDTLGTYDAFIQHLAALGDVATAEEEENGGVVNSVDEKRDENNKDEKDEKEKDEEKDEKEDSGAISVAAAAAVAGAAGAAAAAALFTDDHSPAIITPKIPTLSDFKIEPVTVTMGDKAPAFTLVTSDSKGVITYTSNDTGVAMIDSKTGKINLVGIGEVRFTAKQEADSANNYAAAEKISTMLTVTAKVDTGIMPDWTGLKARWTKINAIAHPKYIKDMDMNASIDIAIKRRAVYDWLIADPLSKVNSFFSNSDLYETILKWLIKWDEFGGKIRTIVSVRGGQQMSKDAMTYYPAIDGKENYNKTKVVLKFKSQKEPDQIARIRKTIGIEGQNDYGYFYTGFSWNDDNLTRYNQGNFKDMITTLEGGGNVGIFGYGYSGSGKTYTLTNYELNDPSANGIAIQLIKELKTNGYTIGLTVNELYCKDVNIVGGKINIRKKDLHPYTNDIESFDVDTFIKEINNVKLQRIKNEHIKYTLNNPESSRGHLFYTFTLTKRGKKPGKLIICDMGGRENPIELSETSYMIIADNIPQVGKQRRIFNERNNSTEFFCKNESYVGQIAERVGNDMLRFYVKDPNDDTKWLKNPITNNLIFQHIKLEFVEGKKDTHGNPVGKNAKRITGAFIKGSETSKCDSLLKSTFGSFFMTPSKKDEIDENYVRTRLEITKDGKKAPGVAQSESNVVTKITKSLNSFIDCCKEGMYINETINHLVAYVNFLSNVGEYLNNIEVEKPIISNDHVSGLTTPQSVYHSERHIYDPRAVIKKMYEPNLENIMGNTHFITKSDDTVGIITELKQIKNPSDDNTSPSMLCFIACINSDNLQPKSQIATQNTLEFAMSVSASNGPPENAVVVSTKAKPETKNQKLPKTEEPLNNFYTRPDIIRNAATQKLDKLIKLGKSADDKIAAIINFVIRKEPTGGNNETPSEYEKTLSENQQNLPNYRDHYERIYKAFIAYYITKGPTRGISNVLSSYKKQSNRELVKSVIKAGGAKTRKRESRREKKNRKTRRRNRV